LIITYR